MQNRILEHEGERVAVTPKVVDTLLVLVEHAGTVISKEQLMDAVWPDVTVVESGLSRNISVLRKAIEGESGEGSYIETVPRRGYRFVGELTVEREAPPAVGALTSAEEAQIRFPPTQVQAAVKSTRHWTIGAWALAALLVALCGLALGLRETSQGPVMARAQDPNVQIGHHLLYKMTPDETRRALKYFRSAALENPGSAEAHAGLAMSMINLSNLGVMTPSQALPEARQAVETATELNPNLAVVQTALAMLRTVEFLDLAQADASFRRALELDKNSVQTRAYYARLKAARGDFAGARALLHEAKRLDPVSPAIGAQYCQLQYFQRDFEAAAAECRKVLDREPGYALAHYYLGLSLGYMGRYEEALQSLDRTRLSPGVLEVDRAWLRSLQGNRDAAESALAVRRELVKAGRVSVSATMIPAILVGNRDEAFEAMQAVVEQRTSELLNLRVDPRLDALRDDPRYLELLRKAGLDEPLLTASR